MFDAATSHDYRSRPSRLVPGLDALHRMTMLLLAERMPANGRLLVLGAGGGLELEALAQAQPHWHFDGVDPSGPMLDLARHATAEHADRMAFHQGYINDAPAGPFDGAVSLLTFHFIPHDARHATLTELWRRLRPGSPLVLAHISFAQEEPERSQWIARHLAFGQVGAIGADQAATMAEAMRSRLTILAPHEEEATLAGAGFTGITPFYHAFSFRGWIAYKP